MSRFCKAAASLLLALPAIAQPQTFATVTIKPASSAQPRPPRMQVQPNGDLIASAAPVNTLLSYAYDVPVNPSPRLSGLPDWTFRNRYDIEAKAPAGLPQSEVRTRTQKMIRKVLADRFGLVIRSEIKTMPVYVLTVAGGGPKLQASALGENDCATQTDLGSCHNFAGGLGHPLVAKAINMDDLAHYISNWTDLPVVDRTALTGLYTVNTQGWVPMRLPPPPPGSTPAANPFAGLPTIFTVLGQLGLELNKQEDALPIYTVDHIRPPTID